MKSQGGRILIVNGNPDIRDFLGISLGLAGFCIEIAKGNHDAIIRLKSRVPDLVVVDVAACWRDGRNLMFRLRHTPQWADVPVIVITAYEYDGMNIRHMQAYASMRNPRQFLRRPMNMSSLAEDIGKILQMKPRRREPSTREKVNDLLIDADSETLEKVFEILHQELCSVSH